MTKSELPKGWEWKKIGDLLESITNGSNAKQCVEKLGYPISRIETLQNYRFDKNRVRYAEISDEEFEKFKYKPGDIAFNHINSFELVGKVAIYEEYPANLVHGINLQRLRLKREGVFPYYIYWFLRSPTLRKQLEPMIKRAISQASVNQKDIRSLEIPVPPLEEQRRIVARIEELLSRLEQAKSLRQKSLTETFNILSSVLNQVFSDGKLAKWDTTPLRSLSERITKGESPKWQGFGYVSHGPLFIRSENVLWGSLDVRNAARIPYDFHKKLGRSQLKRGDVLVNLVGASIGRCAVVPEQLGEANVNQAVAVITPKIPLDSSFLKNFLLSPKVQQKIELAKVEATRPNISLTDLRNLSVPVLPLNEQRRIVAYLDHLRERVNELQHLQSETEKEIAQITQSILSSAFQGEL